MGSYPKKICIVYFNFLVAASVILILISGEFFRLRFSGRLSTILMKLFLLGFSPHLVVITAGPGLVL